jgi:hypothetical protein
MYDFAKMNARALLIFCLVGAAGYFPYRYAVYHWEQYYADCRVQYRENERILRLPICRNAEERLLHGQKVQTLCLEAQKENRIKPSACATATWWRQSEIVKLYNRTFGSQLMLLAIIVPPVLLAVWITFTRLVTNHRGQHTGQPTFVFPQLPWTPSVFSHGRSNSAKRKRYSRVHLMDE